MAESSLSFASTSSFRNSLMVKNLAPYSVQGVYTPPVSQVNYETILSVSNVIDSPGELITNGSYSNLLYPLNEYGPDGGYSTQINFNGPPLPVASNQGEYNPNDTVLDLVNEFFIDAAYIQNRYGPQGSFNDLVIITDVENNNKIYQPYWEPPSFAPSSYSPYNILLSPNPIGSNGLLSQDSFIARFGASELNSLLKKRIDAELFQNTLGLINLESLQDPFEISMMLSGQQPLVYKNWKITVPENPVVAAADFLTRLAGAYWPVSLIPGDYFNDNNENSQTQQTSNALNTVNQLTGGLLGPILNLNRSGSQIFLANTGNGQRSVLFANINYNRYQPSYDKDYGLLFGVAQGLVNLLVPNINPGNGTLVGGYYVGNRTSEPSYITSPPNQIPVNAFGQQDPSPVYGPSEMGILYEGNESALSNFGLGGRSYSDGGGIDGGFVWVSPKYKANAGFRAIPGGGSGTMDEDYQLVSGNITRDESTNIEFKETSILDQTQRLIDSADGVTGEARLKHVGNAMNQISKVFNDGYKEITKGSQVLSYTDNTTGGAAGIEYCRVFTKDNPYYTYNDLQKTDGITTSGRRFTHSVLDNTYNLNIVPLRNPGSTNIIANNVNGTGGYAKKYMFSIENLAWRTSSRPGFTYDELPVCEKGPNGGRVMWFPPYDLKFSDSSTANWNDTSFLGRPEPIYTYKNTSRSGQLSWKIIVDSPSVMNTIVEKQLKGQSKERINSIIDSFFAGCVKYDIYELALKFNTIPTKDLYTYQEILSNPRLTDEELKNVSANIPRENSVPQGGAGTPADAAVQTANPDTSIDDFKKNYSQLAFYFDNDIPDPKSQGVVSSVPYNETYSAYTAPSNITKYVDTASGIFNDGSVNRNVKEFFDNIVISNFNKIANNSSNFIVDAYNILKEKKGTISIQMVGSASATASVPYNTNLSKRRNDSVIQFLKTYKIGDANLAPFFEDKTFQITLQSGQGEQIVIPQGESGSGSQVDCSKNIKSNTNTTTSNKEAEVYSTDAMACRRVKISSILVTPTVTTTTTTQKVEIVTPEVSATTINTIKPVQTIEIQQKLKEGIGKRIIRQLLTECDYFDVIKESNPILYGSIADKIRFFNPAFHSMTPEGLNARLTFLNQCVRPGETIPVIGVDGKPKYNDAVNTAFGAPPVLVLRIGDFYNGKIIPKTISFTYEPLILDMNPEGIGIQPMIANVNLSFDMIGGMGLARPVEQLQNALSFNFYANTEIYDERATWTEDTSALDAKLVQSILDAQPPVTVNNVQNDIVNDGGNTIGDILTNIPVTSGQTGEITYMTIMDKILDSTQEYYTNILNQSDSIVKSYNYGVWQLITQDRLYTSGEISLNSSSVLAPIYGKPEGVETKVDSLFSTFISDINADNPTNKNYIISRLVGFKFTDATIQRVKTNMNQYINTLKGDYSSGLFTKIQEIVVLEQNMVQIIRKINLVTTKTDGKILDTGVPRVYTISGTTEVNTASTGVLDTYQELCDDYRLVGVRLDEFNLLMDAEKIITTVTNPYDGPGQFDPISKQFETASVEDKRQFMVMAQIFNDKNKLTQFINTIISGELKNDNKLVRKFNNICDDFADLTKKELVAEQKFIKTIRDKESYSKFVNQPAYPKGKLRKFTYTTVPDPATETQQKTDIANLYKTVNVNNDPLTFDGKIKFD
jgi:outer membrane protein OmpA-like peptidoglycan-associated protein